MAVICPTITAADPHEYRQQMELIAQFAKRVHIDLADGIFTGNKLVALEHVWWPNTLVADIHIMYKHPMDYLDQLVGLRPNLVVAHAEAEGNFVEFSSRLRAAGIKAGVCLLADTQPEVIQNAIDSVDHVLVFSGNLGHYGGHADLSLLSKIEKIKSWKPDIEIGWDGGINLGNAAELVKGGVSVLNTGGFIQHAQEPANAYAKLKEVVQSVQL